MTRPPNETLIAMEGPVSYNPSTSSCSIFSNKLKKNKNWNSFLTFTFTYYASAITRQERNRVRASVPASDFTHHQEKWPGLEILPSPQASKIVWAIEQKEGCCKTVQIFTLASSVFLEKENGYTHYLKYDSYLWHPKKNERNSKKN